LITALALPAQHRTPLLPLPLLLLLPPAATALALTGTAAAAAATRAGWAARREGENAEAARDSIAD
jgi:hypothetical protein